MVIGQQKGRDQEKIKRNFGMPRPEGYRKALRLMEMAERFKMPSSPSSTPRCLPLASVPKSVASPKPSPAT